MVRFPWTLSKPWSSAGLRPLLLETTGVPAVLMLVALQAGVEGTCLCGAVWNLLSAQLFWLTQPKNGFPLGRLVPLTAGCPWL